MNAGPQDLIDKRYVASGVFFCLSYGRSMLAFEQMKVFLKQHRLPCPVGWSDVTGWRWAEALAEVKKEETAAAINSAAPYIAFSLDESTDNSSVHRTVHSDR
jgi:hypothetical protein